MRRLAFVLLICLLPLQGLWAASAGLCDEAGSRAALGQHAHPAHPSAAQEAGAEQTQAGGDSLGSGADCQGCTGACVALTGRAPRLADGATASLARAQPRLIPEPPRARLLRPPLPLVA